MVSDALEFSVNWLPDVNAALRPLTITWVSLVPCLASKVPLAELLRVRKKSPLASSKSARQRAVGR